MKTMSHAVELSFLTKASGGLSQLGYALQLMMLSCGCLLWFWCSWKKSSVVIVSLN